MAEITATVTQENLLLANTNLANPVVVESMDFIADVDVATQGKLNGSVLVYRTTTNKWTSTTTLDAQNMEGGFF
jgi:hypothetical protein